MRAVFHIGRPKVGSTSIQGFLYHNTQGLAERGVLHHRLNPNFSSQWELPIAALTECGVQIPDSHMSKLIQIEDRTSQKRYADTMMRKFEDSLARHSPGKDLFVASSEHAVPYLRTPAEVTRFDTLLRRYFDDVTYVLYIRDQVSLSISAYSERIKRGGTKPLDKYLNTALRENRFDHARILTPWVEAVGPDKIKVRVLDRADMVGGDLIDDFCDSAGIDPAGLKRPKPANPSLTRDAAEVMRVLNGFLPVLLDDGSHNPLRHGLLARLLKHYTDAPPLQLTDQQEARIREKYAPGNEAVRKMFFPDRDGLFAPRASNAEAKGKHNPQIDTEAALQIALSMLIAARQGQIAPLSRRALRRSTSLDPLTANTAGTSPDRASVTERWPVLRSNRFRRLNPLRRG